MTWNRRNRIASYLRSSLWIIPVGAVVIEQVFGVIVSELDVRFGWAGAGFGVEGAKVVCNSVITLALSFFVFTFGSLLVAIQVASGQYTPRIIATTLLRDNVIRYTVGLFVFALLFAIKALNRIETGVPQLLVLVAGLLGFVCIAAFLFLIDYAARLLRPVSLAKSVGEIGLAVMESVYPEKLAEAKNVAGPIPDAGPVERTIEHHGTSAIVLAVNGPQLVAEAEKAQGVIEFAPQVGVFLLHGGLDRGPRFTAHANHEPIKHHAI